MWSHQITLRNTQNSNKITHHRTRRPHKLPTKKPTKSKTITQHRTKSHAFTQTPHKLKQIEQNHAITRQLRCVCSCENKKIQPHFNGCPSLVFPVPHPTQRSVILSYLTAKLIGALTPPQTSFFPVENRSLLGMEHGSLRPNEKLNAHTVTQSTAKV